MKYQLNKYHLNTPEQKLLEDLIKVSNTFSNGHMTREDYNEKGEFHSSTFENRFGSWNKSLEKAGLKINVQRNISAKELFENIESVWIQLGRQPTSKEFKAPLSRYSIIPYKNKFGTWRKALEAFVEFIEDMSDQPQEKVEIQVEIIEEKIIKHKTKRIPSDRLKVQVLMRDGNKCRLCGITVTGNSIHFDHIFPWSKGGETVLENLQVLCETHNLAKGNLEYDFKQD
jgi:hypothetical protein